MGFAWPYLAAGRVVSTDRAGGHDGRHGTGTTGIRGRGTRRGGSVEVDPPGYLRVRRLNVRRPGERQLNERRAPGADSPSIGQPASDYLDGDQIHLSLRIADSTEFAVRVYAHQIRSDRDRVRFEQ